MIDGVSTTVVENSTGCTFFYEEECSEVIVLCLYNYRQCNLFENSHFVLNGNSNTLAYILKKYYKWIRRKHIKSYERSIANWAQVLFMENKDHHLFAGVHLNAHCIGYLTKWLVVSEQLRRQFCCLCCNLLSRQKYQQTVCNEEGLVMCIIMSPCYQCTSWLDYGW